MQPTSWSTCRLVEHALRKIVRNTSACASGGDGLLAERSRSSRTSPAASAYLPSISDAAHRRREPWVVDGLRWLHHPLHAAHAQPWIGPGLDLLEEVRRTGDIFLPKRWLDAVLSGHRSAAAAATVRRFLATRPAGYPPALTRMILASADLLFRAARREA